MKKSKVANVDYEKKYNTLVSSLKIYVSGMSDVLEVYNREIAFLEKSIEKAFHKIEEHGSPDIPLSTYERLLTENTVHRNETLTFCNVINTLLGNCENNTKDDIKGKV